MTSLSVSVPYSSPLSQGRELKYPGQAGHQLAGSSPLSQGRELKFLLLAHGVFSSPSPLSQGRELKLHPQPLRGFSRPVAPLAGAGIEIEGVQIERK